MLLLKNRNRTAPKKRKIRRLGREPSPSTEKTFIHTSASVKIACFLAVFGVVIFTNYKKSVLIFNDFANSYEEQYHTIVHNNPDYCRNPLDSKKLIEKIQSQLLNQEIAMDQLEHQLRNDSNLISVAIIGSSGVGKSLFASLLSEHYQWNEKIKHYVWSTYEPIETKIKTIDNFLTDLSNCGQNLIILDDLAPKDFDIIKYYYQKTERAVNESTKHNKRSIKLIVIYLIHINSFAESDILNYDHNLKFLKELNQIKSIVFRQFNENDLNSCIQHEIKSLNLTLTDKEYAELVQSIDVKSSGCKNVNAKVKLYAKLG